MQKCNENNVNIYANTDKFKYKLKMIFIVWYCNIVSTIQNSFIAFNPLNFKRFYNFVFNLLMESKWQY